MNRILFGVHSSKHICNTNPNSRIFPLHRNLFRTSIIKREAKEETLPDGQIRYSTNKKWHAIMNYVSKPTNTPYYQYPVIALCALVASIYFCFIHTRSDLDDILDKNFESLQAAKGGR
ncbi:hypothetical protein EWB00_009319 [Schistosoma japonicum]|uniref:SJCHGC05367 protein n=1 Tax=Schistosoma japonicum TaxID=6182 RepID=Q5DA45_SCHJA|nr:SJCHGC05367 protein [Schistosoma japonicum]KAH8873475.1 hypothetical protein KSF78_0008037 [Schistosoma japonicum]TNN05356.1 hypothetical protein EWB00_009319 [Schistosoma japonicum]